MEATLKNSYYSSLARHKFIGLLYNKTNLDTKNKDYCEIKRINERISHNDLTRRINKVFFSSIENKECSSIFNQLTKIFKRTSIDNCSIQFIIEFVGKEIFKDIINCYIRVFFRTFILRFMCHCLIDRREQVRINNYFFKFILSKHRWSLWFC